MESLPRHYRTSIAAEIAAGVFSVQPATAFHEQNMSFVRIRGRWILYRVHRLRFFKAWFFGNAVLPGGGEKDMRLRNCRYASMLVALVLGLTVIPGTAGAQNGWNNTQQTELYKMQAAFHRYATVHDPVLGDSADVITQRIRGMLSLWTSNAVLSVQGFGAIDGYYIGNGDPGNASTCPEPTGAEGAYRGTLCTYFKWVAGSFQAANKSLC